MAEFDFYDDIDAKLPKFSVDEPHSFAKPTSKEPPAGAQRRPQEVEAADAEGGQNAEEGPLALAVEGLAWYTTDAMIERAFGRYGKIRSVHLYDDLASCRSRGIAVVIFFRHSDAVNAQCALHDRPFDCAPIKVTFLGDASAFSTFDGIGRPPCIPLVEQRLHEETATRTGHGMGGDYPPNSTWFHSAPIAPGRPWKRMTQPRSPKVLQPPLISEAVAEVKIPVKVKEMPVDSDASSSSRIKEVTYPSQPPTAILSYGQPVAPASASPPVVQQGFSYFAFHQQQQQLFRAAPQYHPQALPGPVAILPHNPPQYPTQSKPLCPPPPHAFLPIQSVLTVPDDNGLVLENTARLFPRSATNKENQSSSDDMANMDDFLVPTTELSLTPREVRKAKHRNHSPPSERQRTKKSYHRRLLRSRSRNERTRSRSRSRHKSKKHDYPRKKKRTKARAPSQEANNIIGLAGKVERKGKEKRKYWVQGDSTSKYRKHAPEDPEPEPLVPSDEPPSKKIHRLTQEKLQEVNKDSCTYSDEEPACASNDMQDDYSSTLSSSLEVLVNHESGRIMLSVVNDDCGNSGTDSLIDEEQGTAPETGGLCHTREESEHEVRSNEAHEELLPHSPEKHSEQEEIAVALP